MGIGSNLMVEIAEQEYLERKEEWIRNELGNPDADEFTDGWQELSDQFDEESASDDYDPYDFEDWDVKGKSRIEIFDETIEASTEILQLKFSQLASRNVLVMLHGHVVAAVEAYLASTFIDRVLSSERNLRRLVENDPEFAKRKFTLKEIFTKQEDLKNDVNRYLKDLIFHQIDKVNLLYKSVLDIDFGDVEWLYEAISLRHHCVHRAGYDKDGNEVDLTAEKVEKLISSCCDLVHEIESTIMSMPEDGDFFWKT